MNARTMVSVEDVMTPEPVLLRHDDSLPRAARTLEEYESVAHRWSMVTVPWSGS